MSRRPLLLWGLTMTLLGVSAALSVGRQDPFDQPGLAGVGALVIYAALSVSVATVGALIVSRHPRHRVGWIFLLLAIWLATTEVASGYGLLANEVGLPGGDYGLWFANWAWTVEVAAWALIAVAFPDGELPSPRWRWVAPTAAAGAVLTATGTATGSTGSTDYHDYASGSNPLLVTGPVPTLLQWGGLLLLVAALLGGAAAVVVRLRRSRGVERQQLKWFAVAASAVAVVGPVLVALWMALDVAVLIVLAFNGLPIVLAAGVAILRHRLYDIDLVIKRTLVYAALTVTLVGTYLLSVLTLQVLLRPVAGESDLAVAGSTLAVAALFRPLRARIQRVVDHRFFRSRYDAARTLDGFSATLRHELDLDSLGSDLRDVVLQTMQPEHVSLWLRPEGPR